MPTHACTIDIMVTNVRPILTIIAYQTLFLISIHDHNQHPTHVYFDTSVHICPLFSVPTSSPVLPAPIRDPLNPAPSSYPLLPAVVSLVVVVLLLVTCVVLLVLALAVTATKLNRLRAEKEYTGSSHHYSQTAMGEGKNIERIYDEVEEGTVPIGGKRGHYEELNLETMEKRQYETVEGTTAKA